MLHLPVLLIGAGIVLLVKELAEKNLKKDEITPIIKPEKEGKTDEVIHSSVIDASLSSERNNSADNESTTEE